MKKKNVWWVAALVGVLVGTVNGLFGGGGGMIVVPAFALIFSLSAKNAHATSVLVILLSSIASGIVYVINGLFEMPTGFYVGGGAIVGCVVGALLLSKLKNKTINIIFAIVMVLAGVKMIIW